MYIPDFNCFIVGADIQILKNEWHTDKLRYYMNLADS